MRDITIAELEQQYGTEAVSRALQYMASLRQAEQKFKESADPDRMKQGYEDAFGVEPSGQEVEEGVENWADSMEESGLGIDEE